MARPRPPSSCRPGRLGRSGSGVASLTRTQRLWDLSQITSTMIGGEACRTALVTNSETSRTAASTTSARWCGQRRSRRNCRATATERGSGGRCSRVGAVQGHIVTPPVDCVGLVGLVAVRDARSVPGAAGPHSPEERLLLRPPPRRYLWIGPRWGRKRIGAQVGGADWPCCLRPRRRPGRLPLGAGGRALYLSSRRTAVAPAGGAQGEPAAPDPAEGRVPGNVLVLGAVSLITDISSEMVSAVLPVYLVFGLGVSLLAVGFVDGLYAGVVVLVSLLAAHVADRTQHRKTVAGAGYGLSAVSKLGLLAVGSSVGGIATVIGVDRIGKGLRTAPRDALISLSSSAETLGRSFGVHRAMDTAGALAGPLVAFFILRGVPEGYDAVFVVSFCVALAGLVVLVAFVRNKRDPLAERADVSLRAGLVLLGRPVFRRVTVRATLLSVVTLSDAFVYLLLQHQLDVSLVYFPLLPLGTSVVYMLGAVPAGRIADRWAAGASSWRAISPWSGSTPSCWRRSRSSQCSRWYSRCTASTTPGRTAC